MNTEQIFNDLVTGRADRIPAWDIAFMLDNDNFRVAGGCFMDGVPNDYDVYPAEGVSFNSISIRNNAKSLQGSASSHRSSTALEVRSMAMCCSPLM